MLFNVEKEQYLEKPKANQVWASADGIEYTVFSVRKTGKTRGRAKVWTHRVDAYTFDLSVDRPSGHLDGKRCHWVEMESDEFVESFTRK